MVWCAVLGRLGARFWDGLVRGFGAVGCAVLGRLGARFWGGLVRGFGVFWCAVLTFFIFFVSEPHDFAFAFDPEFIFSA